MMVPPSYEQLDGLGSAELGRTELAEMNRFWDSAIPAWEGQEFFDLLFVRPDDPNQPTDPTCQRGYMFVRKDNRDMIVCNDDRSVVVQCGNT